MDFALVRGPGALTMHVAVDKGTFVCAIGDDICSLAVELVIFELSDVVSTPPDVSAESVQLPIHEWAFSDPPTACSDHSCDSMGLSLLVHLPNQPPVGIIQSFLFPLCHNFEILVDLKLRPINQGDSLQKQMCH